MRQGNADSRYPGERLALLMGDPGCGYGIPVFRIRPILTSEHTKAQLDRALETLEMVAKRMSLLGTA